LKEPKNKNYGGKQKQQEKKEERKQGGKGEGREKNPSLLPWKAIESGGKTSQMEVAKPYSF
jgi:hypothetical protein